MFAMQISAVHRKRLDSKISFVFCWLEFTASSLGCISFKVLRGKMPQIVPNLMNKMFPKVVKVTKSERKSIWNWRDKLDVFILFYFFFNSLLLKELLVEDMHLEKRTYNIHKHCFLQCDYITILLSFLVLKSALPWSTAEPHKFLQPKGI